MDSRCPNLLLPLLFLAAALAPPSSEATAAPAGVIRLRTSGKRGLQPAPRRRRRRTPPCTTALSSASSRTRVTARAAGSATPPRPPTSPPPTSSSSRPAARASSRSSTMSPRSSCSRCALRTSPPPPLKLSLVNGVLFTGGSAKQGLYFETIKKVFQYVLDKNDAGEQFPLFAQCLGFELVSMIVSKDNNILEKFDALNQASTLQFPSYDFEGSVFQRFDPDLIKKVSTSCLVMQQHRYGISPRRLQEKDALSSFFKILTTSPDENGKVYVSTVQAHKYPITCTQWHPEKAIFEWRNPVIPHSKDAVQVTQHFANHFISQARKSPNRPPADKVLDYLIYNYSPTGKKLKSFEEVYVFS
ncbi:hypothetical protein SORBI_3009G199100 [Sorghum bicolor]|uniref:folate gamma-glutamyl hydrolase n=1 Tax=Sorghum bicolor TaxID=4558 RepID=C5Z0Z7_SORBI|nr:hypothetical protein SORBI_3009G199100 [Sorghum bicolor]